MDMQILYHERRVDPKFDNSTDLVEVEVRRYEWDLVISEFVKVDGKVEINNRRAYNPYDKKDALWIRMGIAIFDTLFENHPSKERLT